MRRTAALDGGGLTHMIYCPACEANHGYDARWTFNGDFEKPTFRPSLITGDSVGKRCHSFVTDGKIEYLSDCYHDMAGKTTELPDVDL